MFRRKILITHKEKYKASIYSKQLPTAGKKVNIIYASPGWRRADGWRMDWRTDQDESAASNYDDRPTRIQKSSRASDDHTHE